jgi:hypothetical protein
MQNCRMNKHEPHKNKQVPVSLDRDMWSWSDNTLVMVELHTKYLISMFLLHKSCLFNNDSNIFTSLSLFTKLWFNQLRGVADISRIFYNFELI